MTGDGIDGNIDRLVRTRWLAIGLSQTDLAEVLGAAFQPNRKDSNGSNGVDAGRLMQVAEALDIPIASVHGPAIGTEQEERDLSSVETLNSLQSLLELRLLRAFNELQDQRTKQTLVHLAEQIVKRQANRSGDAG
jgi:transcriptional regulator with XRE-family HTH domain